MKNSLKLSVVMPALNEEQHIALAVGNTLSAFDDFKIMGEVIVINDGSSDKTGPMIEDLKKTDNRIFVVHHEKPRGIGAAFWKGVDCSNNEIVTMIPGDNENDPWETIRYFKLLEHVDMVIPFVYNRDIRPLWRNILSSIYRFIINSSFGVNLNYTNGTILYRKNILKELKTRNIGFFFQTDILIKAIKQGYLFAEVPYRLGLRASGKSKAMSFPSLLQVMKGYLSLIKNQYGFSGKNQLKPVLEETSTAQRHSYENEKYKI